MAQHSQSTTAARNTVPGTANPNPVAPPLFTSAPRREYIPDAKRVGGLLQTPELELARKLFAEGDYAGARAEAKRVLKHKDAPAEAKITHRQLEQFVKIAPGGREPGDGAHRVPQYHFWMRVRDAYAGFPFPPVRIVGGWR